MEHISHRHYSTGFFYGQPGQFTDDARYVRDWQIVAKVQSCDGDGNAVLTLNNHPYHFKYWGIVHRIIGRTLKSCFQNTTVFAHIHPSS